MQFYHSLCHLDILELHPARLQALPRHSWWTQHVIDWNVISPLFQRSKSGSAHDLTWQWRTNARQIRPKSKPSCSFKSSEYAHSLSTLHRNPIDQDMYNNSGRWFLCVWTSFFQDISRFSNDCIRLCYYGRCASYRCCAATVRGNAYWPMPYQTW